MEKKTIIGTIVYTLLAVLAIILYKYLVSIDSWNWWYLILIIIFMGVFWYVFRKYYLGDWPYKAPTIKTKEDIEARAKYLWNDVMVYRKKFWYLLGLFGIGLGIYGLFTSKIGQGIAAIVSGVVLVLLVTLMNRRFGK